MATILDVTGATYPSEYDGNAIPPCDCESLARSFTADDAERGPLLWEHESNATVRVGKWKLARIYPKSWGSTISTRIAQRYAISRASTRRGCVS